MPETPSHWIGFDLGGTKMQATVFDAAFKPLAEERKKTKAKNGSSSGLERVADTIKEALAKANLKSTDLAGIGIGCPGPVNPDSGTVYELTNLAWKNLDLRAALEKEFKSPVVVTNDVDAGTFGEYIFGAAQGARAVLGVFPGTGIGGGFVYEGAIYSGTGISAMEIGHIPVQPNGALCGCGRRGCLEAVAGRLAIATAAAAAVSRGEAPALLKLAGTDLGAIRSGLLAQAIREGDSVVEAIVVNAAEWLGRGIGALVNVLAPDVIVLGGGLVEAMPGLFRKQVQRGAADVVMRPYEKRYRIEIAALGDRAATLGAAAWAARRISDR